jgi:hypothetical protein
VGGQFLLLGLSVDSSKLLGIPLKNTGHSAKIRAGIFGKYAAKG